MSSTASWGWVFVRTEASSSSVMRGITLSVHRETPAAPCSAASRAMKARRWSAQARLGRPPSHVGRRGGLRGSATRPPGARISIHATTPPRRSCGGGLRCRPGPAREALLPVLPDDGAMRERGLRASLRPSLPQRQTLRGRCARTEVSGVSPGTRRLMALSRGAELPARAQRPPSALDVVRWIRGPPAAAQPPSGGGEGGLHFSVGGGLS
jgi:hypothetical protein